VRERRVGRRRISDVVDHKWRAALPRLEAARRRWVAATLSRTRTASVTVADAAARLGQGRR
jgi:hypothetical protein